MSGSTMATLSILKASLTLIAFTAAFPSDDAPSTKFAGLRFIGRVDPTNPVFSWAGSGFETKLSGTGGTISFTATGDNYIDVNVDGCTVASSPVTTGTPIKLGPLPKGDHVVQVIKRSDPVLGSLKLDKVDMDGPLMKTPIPTHRIEVIGDSISIGYGVEKVIPCSETAETGNVAHGFAWLTAQKVGAEVMVTGYGGKGIYRSATSLPNTTVQMPQLWLDTNPADGDAHTWTFPPELNPHLVVIELGTNDFAYLDYSSGTGVASRDHVDQELFVKLYTKLIMDVKVKYGPTTQFILLGSPMLGDAYPAGDLQHTTLVNLLNKIVPATCPDSKYIHFVDLDPPGDGEHGEGKSGCDYHPNLAQQQQYSEILSNYISKLMDWPRVNKTLTACKTASAETS